MKKTFILAIALLLTLAIRPVFAAEGGEKGASSKAYEHASEQSIFNRVSGWFATFGKSPEEKARILQERKMKRAERHAEKQVRKAQREEERSRRQQASQDREMKNTTRVRNRAENRVNLGATGSKGKGKK